MNREADEQTFAPPDADDDSELRSQLRRVGRKAVVAACKLAELGVLSDAELDRLVTAAAGLGITIVLHREAACKNAVAR